ncbi:MAG: D-glycero-beta-D-manno-heptose-7-phosphate kinase [Acidobacteriota bacterium]|nr:MAG: D-glycero-beta-D-manno-heptose-7-phosphate kinase [Acidobacteriota bacterium]
MNELLERFKDVKVLVVGDLMLDTYLTGSVDRISPEAPVPILHVAGTKSVLGGAANVAANVRGLGASVNVAGFAGKDREAEDLVEALSTAGIGSGGVVVSASRPTTVKTRLIAQHHQFARFDRETHSPLDEEETRALAGRLDGLLDEADAVIISDYAKGVATPEICMRLITKANEKGVGVYVDPKGTNYEKYKSAALLTPNEREALEASRFLGFDGVAVEEAGEAIRRSLDLPALIVTRGERGITIFEAGKGPETIDAHERKVFDVTGAGDTVIAAIAVASAAGADLFKAAGLANLAAGCVIERLGTSAVSLGDLERELEAA